MSNSFENLSFEALEHSLEHEQEKIKVTNRDMRGVPVVTMESLDAAINDYSRFAAAVNFMIGHGAVNRDVILSVESARDNYPLLDQFLKENPIGMFTQEASANMVEESMENFIINGAMAFWKMVKRFGEWIFGIFKSAWEKLTGANINTKRIDSKLNAFAKLIRYVEWVRNNTADLPEAKRTAGFARERSIKFINDNIRQNEMQYLENRALYEVLIQNLATGLSECGSILFDEVNKLMDALTKAENDADVDRLVNQYLLLLDRDAAFKGLSKLIDPVLKELPNFPARMITGIGSGETSSRIHTAMNHLGIAPENGAGANIHPKVYATIMSAGYAAFKPMNDRSQRAIYTDLPALTADLKRLVAKMGAGKAQNPTVEAALLKYNVGVRIIQQYQSRATSVLNLYTKLSAMLEIRNTTINYFITTALSECKELDKWVDGHKNELSIKNRFDRDRLRKEAYEAVKNSHL